MEGVPAYGMGDWNKMIFKGQKPLKVYVDYMYGLKTLHITSFGGEVGYLSFGSV